MRRRERMGRLCQLGNNVELLQNTEVRLVINFIDLGRIKLYFRIIALIVTVTKFSIVIGSPRAYLSRNRRAITWMSNYRYPEFELFVIGFLRNVSYSFRMKSATDVFAQKNFSKDIFNFEICYRYD